MPDRVRPGVDGPASAALLKAGRFFTRWDESDDGRAVFRQGGRAGDVFYRDRWSHDKVVRSTHGVNCTGSCSWKVYVKDGIITWETQQTDYPSVGPDRPEYEPRGCPRGAAFSWYTYSPTRVRYPYVRGVLLEMYREARQRLGDPVLAWARDHRRPARSAAATSRPAAKAGWSAAQLGRGHRDRRGRARPHHQDVRPRPRRRLLADPGHVDGVALRRHPVHPAHRRRDDVVLRLVRRPARGQPPGLRRPDRRPRVRRLVGRDLPDDVGLQRPRHPHARRPLDGRGPLPRHQGRHGQPGLRRQHQVRRRVDARAGRHRRRARDGHGSRAPQGVLRRPRGHPSSHDYVRTYTDLPFLIRLEPRERATTARSCPGKFLTAADLAPTVAPDEDAWKTVLLDESTGEPVVPNGSMGFRYAESGEGRWNLDLEGVTPALTLAGDRRRAGRGAAAGLRGAGRHRLGAAPRRARPPRRRPPGDDRLRPHARPVRRAPRRSARGAGRPATTTSPRPTPRPGRPRSPACPPSSASASPASSPRTPRSPRAAR